MHTHLSWSCNHTVLFILNTQDVKVQLTKAFSDFCQLLQFCRLADVVLDVCETMTKLERGVKEAICIHQSPKPKLEQRLRQVQFATVMGQHHQEESEGR